MPKNTVALKPASRPLTRRNQSEVHIQNNCKAGIHHATLALSSPCTRGSSSCSSSASQSHSAGLPVSSLSYCSTSIDIALAPPPSSMAASSGSVSAQSSISVPSPPSVASVPLPSKISGSASSSACSSQNLSSPNPSASCSSQQTLQDTLYEYVKGLQDAIKVPDPDLAERLLEEIGIALSLPSAVSLVISANGARLIASCVKHFRWNGMQKPLKVPSKIGRSSLSSKVSSSKSEEHDPGGPAEIRTDAFAVEAAEEPSDAVSLATSSQTVTAMDELVPPSALPAVSNESRRKRQRTVGDLEEEEDTSRESSHQNGSCISDNGDKEVARFSSAEKLRKPLKFKGRSVRVGSSRKVGVSELDTERCTHDDRKSETVGVKEEGLGSGVPKSCNCWTKHKIDCTLKVEDTAIKPTACLDLLGGRVDNSHGRLAVKDSDKLPSDGCKADVPEDSEDSASMAGDEINSVYSLAKTSGMSNVVATACSALDKLLTAALQVKRVGPKSKIGTGGLGIGSGRRGKALSAEMYVALTEAFVDMVHVLKDNVDLLSWCLNCLGNILPPGSSERTSIESATINSVAPIFSGKETTATDEDGSNFECSDMKQQSAVQVHATCADQQLLDQKLFPSKALLKLATKYRDHSTSSDFTLKIGSKSPSGSYVAAARSLSSSKSNKGMLSSTFCGGISSESTSSSISALAAVAYAATVPMLAEKAVKAVLSAMQSCDIESHSTLAALRALSAHLSSTNTKSACDDAFAFIIAAMREFVSDAEMQAESCIALGSLTRAVTSTTGHAAWAAITISMDHHQANLAVQRAGCGALQVLCTRTGLGVPEWRTGKRPLRASRDADREAGARALISSMSSFPDDVRIQWHGCSTLWTLVHSAGVKSVANMVKYGAVAAVVGAMSVCRMNEMMQQEGCNVIGTMVRTLAENGHEIGLFLSFPPNGISLKVEAAGENDGKMSEEALDKKGISSTDWWAALCAVVSAMKMFRKSKSLQSNGTFALGCILKGSGETASLSSTPSDILPLPRLPVSNGKPTDGTETLQAIKKDTGSGKNDSIKSQPLVNRGDAASFSNMHPFPGKDIVDNVERISAAVEVTMAAMREFSKVETVQVWGCAVLQQAFLAYVHYAKCLAPVSEAHSSVISSYDPESSIFAQTSRVPSTSSRLENDSCALAEKDKSTCSSCVLPVKSSDASTAPWTSPIPSPADSLAKLILSQATSAMCMISRTMALSYNSSNGGVSQNQTKLNSSYPVRGKPVTCSRLQTSSSNQFFSSVRQSWCAALGAIGDVFGYLTRNSEVAIGKAGFTSTDCMEFFRSNKSFFDRSSCKLNLHMDLKGCCDADRSESEDGEQSERNAEWKSLDITTGKQCRDQEFDELTDSHQCSGSSWIDWAGFGASQQQAVKDIKAWQEATESMSKIAEHVGFPLSVKNAILSIRTIFYKLEDAETVIWACHALVSLYLTWENLHLFKPGIEVDREEYKAKIWGEGEAGVRQLLDLVVHWTNQSRPDVTSLALQALYGACVFAATVQEIEKVFAPGGSGAEAVLGAMQKALVSGSAQHRRKVVQQACCVLATVCGYSIRAQVAIAAQGGADLILTALDRYNEDSQIQVNGLHALGINSHAQPDFDAIWNAAISKTGPGWGSKSSRRRRGSHASASVVGLTHIFREGIHYPAVRDTVLAEEGSMESSCFKGKWNPHFEMLVLNGAAQIGLFRTALLAAPGCGGPSFAVELLRRLSQNAQPQSTVEMQAHICFVIGYMAEHDSVWRKNFVDAGALEAILRCMSTIYSWKQTVFSVFGLLSADDEVEIKTETGDLCKMGNSNLSDSALNGLDSRIQCAAAWAIAGLVKDQADSVSPSIKSVVQALVVALHRYGGLLSVPPYGLRSKKLQVEVCAPARLALARIGVFRVAANSQVVYLVHEAAETGDVSCLKAFAEKGVDVFVADSDGKTGEWHAELFGQIQAVQFFKEQLQLQGKKKAREKAKAKSKQSNRKKVIASMLSNKEQELGMQSAKGDAMSNTSAEIEATSVSIPAGSDSVSPAQNFLSGDCSRLDQPLVGEVRDAGEGEGKEISSQKASKNTKKKDLKCQKTVESDESSSTVILEHNTSTLSVEQEQLSDHLNTALSEAMASGDVEKMESAIKASEEGGHGIDERLLKKVKGALVKRLKRREKASALEDELSAAIEEASYSRLDAAILAIEQSSRFATALQEKLRVARNLLLDIGGGKVEIESQGTSEHSGGEELLSIEERAGEKACNLEQEDALVIDRKDELVTDEGDNEVWISTHKGRRRKERENLDISCSRESLNQISNARGRKERSLKPRRQRASNSWQTISVTGLHSYNSRGSGASHVPSLPDAFHRATPSVAGQDLPPLLPTPSHPLSSLRPAGQPRSVIMPPKSAAQASTSCEHNPITPQLFPSNRSPLICDADFGDYTDSPGLSQLSLLLSSSWSSPKSSSLADESYRLSSSRWGTWSAPRSSTPMDEQNYGLESSKLGTWSDSPSSGSQGYIATLLATLFPVERLPSSSTTLFSASLGEYPVPSVPECPKFSSPLSTPALHDGSGLNASSDMLAFLDTSNAGQGDRLNDLFSRSHVPCISGGVPLHSQSSLFSEENPCRMTTVQQEVAASSLQSRLQAALLEASLEDSCCICFDMPKDAALVPCGHRMCKVCAEQMRCIREHCPICNRYIDAVLALYG